MKYIKVFEKFKENEIDNFKSNFNDLLVELFDKGFEAHYDFHKPYNSRDEITINIYRTNGTTSILLYNYEDVSEYLKMIKDYMYNYYNTELEVEYQKKSFMTNRVKCSFDKFISTEEDNMKVNNIEPVSDDYKFLTIKLKFIINNKI